MHEHKFYWLLAFNAFTISLVFVLSFVLQQLFINQQPAIGITEVLMLTGFKLTRRWINFCTTGFFAGISWCGKNALMQHVKREAESVL